MCAFLGLLLESPKVSFDGLMAILGLEIWNLWGRLGPFCLPCFVSCCLRCWFVDPSVLENEKKKKNEGGGGRSFVFWEKGCNFGKRTLNFGVRFLFWGSVCAENGVRKYVGALEHASWVKGRTFLGFQSLWLVNKQTSRNIARNNQMFLTIEHTLATIDRSVNWQNV